MAAAQDRKIATYSKGMRQRIKVAAALVHDPELLLLDEPFNGMDPRQRLHMMDLLETLGDEGRTILFSSHILEEVERLSGTIQVIVAGRLAASGDFRAIRRLMTSRPHVFLVAHLRRPAARRGADRPARRERGGDERPRAAGEGLGLRRVQPGDRRAHRGSMASSSASCCPRTSRWRACSPTWWRPEMLSVQARTVASITLRATLGRKRALLFALPPLILVLVTAALKAADPAQADWPTAILGGFGLAVVLPLTALIVGTSVLGAEIDDGSVVHLLATPVRRSTVILSKFAVATGLTMAFAAVPELLAGLIATGGATQAGHRDVRRGTGRLGHLQRGVRDDLRAHHPGHRRGPALPAGLGVAAGQRGQRGPGAVGRAVLAGDRELDRPGRQASARTWAWLPPWSWVRWSPWPRWCWPSAAWARSPSRATRSDPAPYP